MIVDAGRDPETGRRRQKWHSGFRTQKDAQRALADILGRLDNGSYVPPSRQTVAEYLREWFPRSRPASAQAPGNPMNETSEAHIIPTIGATPLQALSATSLNRFYADLLHHGRATAKAACHTNRPLHPHHFAKGASRRRQVGQARPKPRRQCRRPQPYVPPEPPP